MQTFLTDPNNYHKTAASLDRQRLGKQRVEVLQILNALTTPGYGWQNHPAVRMWRGFEQRLVDYGLVICSEWMNRGYRDTCLGKIADFRDPDCGEPLVPPPWVTPALCQSHQSNLIRKDPAHYGPLFPGVPDNLPYIWPV